ncbi:MAG: hypothetical protein COA88_03625 [Kordia sp.]|nr:MAG: hypothetical protein COA88_03625 [Kordia sp.]
MKNYLKMSVICLFSLIFTACPQEHDIVVEPVKKIRLENSGDDLIHLLKLEIADQTITLNQFDVGEISDYYIITSDNLNSNILLTVENSEGISQSVQLLINNYGYYTLKTIATPDFSLFDVSIYQD